MTNLASLIPTALPALDRVQSQIGQTTRAPESAAAPQVATEFESVFMSLLIKEMRQSIEGDGLFAGEASDAYGGLFDLYMGDHLANSGGMGLSPVINAYLRTAKTP